MIGRLPTLPAFRYLCVGAICALANWAAMLLIDDQRYLLSSVLLFVPLGTLAYLLHARWTFGAKPTLVAYATYLASLLPNVPLTLLTLALLHDGIGLPLALAIPLGTLVMTAANFFMARWAIVARGAAPARLRALEPR